MKRLSVVEQLNSTMITRWKSSECLFILIIGSKVFLLVLAELENWAKALNMECCILETGSLQVEAVGLYTKSGYQRFPNFGQYEGVENSFCFEKRF